MTGERKHLYVSYSSQDAQLVGQVLQQLTVALSQHNTPVDIWFDQQALMPGTDWEKSIDRQSGVPLDCWSFSRLHRFGPRGS
jgi:hypothetical protein